MEDCKHENSLKLPYSGELCLTCRVILIDDEFDKHLTRKDYEDIMRVLSENYNGVKGKDCVRSYRFVNVDQLCKHRETSRLPRGGRLCLGCDLVLINNKFERELTRVEYHFIVNALRRITPNGVGWAAMFRFFNTDTKTTSIPECDHKLKETLDGVRFCLDCGECTNETQYSNGMYDGSHHISKKLVEKAVTTPEKRLERLET